MVDLHPPNLPHLVMGGDLPVDVKSNVAIEEDKDEEEATWTKRAYEAITSFPPGSAGGPSGLRPSHLSECCQKQGQGAPLAQALGQFVRTALFRAFPTAMREVSCASTFLGGSAGRDGVTPTTPMRRGGEECRGDGGHGLAAPRAVTCIDGCK